MKKVMFISSEGGHISEKYNKKLHFLLYGTRRTPIIYFFIFLINCFISLNLFIKYKPDFVVTTGTHTAVPMCYIAKMFKKKVIWIETFANITTGTMAGKMVYKIADTFVVQWEELKKVYPKAEYWGSIF